MEAVKVTRAIGFVEKICWQTHILLTRIRINLPTLTLNPGSKNQLLSL